MSAPVLTTRLAVGGSEFQANVDLNRGLADALRAKVAEAAQGGPDGARERHVARGKLLPPTALDDCRTRARPKIACGDTTARLRDDGIIGPAQTSDILGLALAATLNAPVPERPRSGVFRM